MSDTLRDRSRHYPDDAPISRVGNKVVARNLAVLHELQPRLKALYQHLDRFADRANSKAIPVALDYLVEGFGTLHTTQLERFEVFADDPDRPCKIAIRYASVGTRELALVPKTNDDYFRFRDQLLGHHLEFTSGTSGGIGKISLKPVVPAGLSFKADSDKASIEVRVWNLVALGSTRYTLAPHNVNADLFDALEKLVRHESGDFYDLTGNAVASKARTA